MPENKKQNEGKAKNKTAGNPNLKDQKKTSNINSTVNAGNISNSVPDRATSGLHTKKGVMGSDSDGQAN